MCSTERRGFVTGQPQRFGYLVAALDGFVAVPMDPSAPEGIELLLLATERIPLAISPFNVPVSDSKRVVPPP